jgi:hypothetical protein
MLEALSKQANGNHVRGRRGAMKPLASERRPFARLSETKRTLTHSLGSLKPNERQPLARSSDIANGSLSGRNRATFPGAGGYDDQSCQAGGLSS